MISKVLTVLVAVFLVSCTLTAGATENSMTQSSVTPAKKLFPAEASVSFASEYVTDGFRVGPQSPVFQPGLSVGILDTGLSLMLWSSMPIDRNYRQFDELDVFANYVHDFFEDKAYRVRFHSFIDYWLYPRSSTTIQVYGYPYEIPMRKGNKLHAGVTLPALLPVPVLGSYLVPSYNAYYWLYWQQNLRDRYQGGARHEFVLSYTRSIPVRVPGLRFPYASLAGSASYNDGAFGVHPAWSHSTAHLTAGFTTLGFNVAASFNQQWSFQPTVNPENERWTSLSVAMAF